LKDVHQDVGVDVIETTLDVSFNSRFVRMNIGF
jgi:hypothetical protein